MLETVLNTRVMEFIPQLAEPPVRLHLLVVDADSAVRSACAEIAASLGYAVESTGDLGQARSLLRGRAADILLVNLPPGASLGLELVSEVKLLYPQTAVIAMTSSASVNAAVEAMRCGASDYLTKPFAIDELSTGKHEIYRPPALCRQLQLRNLPSLRARRHRCFVSFRG